MATHDGHRKRLIDKLAKGDLLEHEILEALLFNAIPRRNTNELAHRLLAQFGSVTGVFSAPMSALQRVEGVGESVASYLFCIGCFLNTYYTQSREEIPKTYEPKSFLEFVRANYTLNQEEVVDCYLIDCDGVILSRRRFTSNEIDSALLASEDFVQMLTEDNTSGLVLVHNHPKGSQKPSKGDDESTRQCILTCTLHNVLFCDHIIASKTGAFSYLIDGRLKTVARTMRVFSKLEDLRG